MTACVGLVHDGHIWMGADSAASGSDFNITTRKDEKIFIKDGKFLIAGTTSFRMISLLRYSFYPPEQLNSQSDEAYMNTSFVDAIRSCFKTGGYMGYTNSREDGGTFLVGYKGRLFEIFDDLQVAENICGYAACGCGYQLCLGSMYSTIAWEPENRIRTALAASESFNAGVRAPFIIKNL